MRNIIVASVLAVSCLLSPVSFSKTDAEFQDEICNVHALGFAQYFAMRDKGYTHSYIYDMMSRRTVNIRVLQYYFSLYEQIKIRNMQLTPVEILGAGKADCIMKELHTYE